MTQDEIIEMARQSGLHVATDVNWMPVIGLAYAKKLVEVATQHERESCAEVCFENADDDTEGVWDDACISCANKILKRGEA